MNPIPYHHENKSSIIFDLNSKNKTNYNKKRSLLIEQVNELRKIDYNIELVYMKNSELELEDSKL
jgi:hypothetical protein